jgi:hypothetical protein
VNSTPNKILLAVVIVLALLVAAILLYRHHPATPPPAPTAAERPAPAPAATPATAPAPAAPADAVIAKARAFLGTEAALDAIRSVHFVGTLEDQRTAADGTKSGKVAIDIIFQKPYQQRIVQTSPTVVETTALDDYEGWLRIQDPVKPKQWRLTVLAPAIVKSLRANTWENLGFYRGIEKRGGRVDLLGPSTVDGVATFKVAFVHDPGLAFYRQFDQATGRLMLTETEQGGRIREEGEIVVNGVRFPQKVITVVQGKDAKGQVVEGTTVIAFDKITVNEAFPESIFETPALPAP